MTKALFQAAQFTPTKYDSAADKAKFANHMVRFIEGGFNDSLFPKWFYTKLSMCFGHIAHYNQGGFYGEWFSSTRARLDFLMNMVRYPAYGQPEYTYCDVEKALKAWVINSGLIEQASARLAAETESRERALLASLKAKYEPSA